MHFNLYLDAPTGQALTAVAKRSKQTRNALVRLAVQEWLQRRKQVGWPEVVLSFAGEPEVPRFEDTRAQLKAPPADPLA